MAPKLLDSTPAEGATKSSMMRRPEIKLQFLFDLVKQDYEANGYKIEILNVNLKHLKPLADRSAERLKSVDVEEYKREREKEGAAKNTIQLELNTLKRAYTLGHDKEYVKSVPKIQRYSKKVLDKTIRKGFFEHDQYLKQRAACKPYLRDCLDFCHPCGWREDEIFQLTWEKNYIDDPPHIRIYKSKNNDGRVLPLLDEHDQPTELYHVIQRRLADRRPECPFIFHYEGRKLNRSTFNKHWRAACKESGVTRYFHDLRRTANRNMKNVGVDQQDRMMIIGHRTTSMDIRYGIVNEEDMKVALAKVFRKASTFKSAKNNKTAQSSETSVNTPQGCVSPAPAELAENPHKNGGESGIRTHASESEDTLSSRVDIFKSVKSFINLFRSNGNK
jgi:site-specific recombinase XerD